PAARGGRGRVAPAPRRTGDPLAQEESIRDSTAVSATADPRSVERLPDSPGTGLLRPEGIQSRPVAGGARGRSVLVAVRHTLPRLRGGTVCRTGEDQVAGGRGPLLSGISLRGAGGTAEAIWRQSSASPDKTLTPDEAGAGGEKQAARLGT